MADVFEIENEIATQISENLRLKLTGDEKQRPTRDATHKAHASPRGLIDVTTPQFTQ